MKYSIKRSSQFKKDFKSLQFNKKLQQEFLKVVDVLASGGVLTEEYKDHELKGKYKEMRECHIFPDILLIYRIKENIVTLLLVRLGSHSKLFK